MPCIDKLSIEAEKRSLFMDWSYKPSSMEPEFELSEMKLFVQSGTERHRELTEAIRAESLSSVGAVILNVARDAVRIFSTVPDDYSNLGKSRFGGFPDLSCPSLFPKTDSLHWIFLAQLELGELAPFNDYLPRAGLLNFFVDSTESLNARVLFCEGGLGVLRTVRYRADEMLSPEDDYTQAPHRVAFQRIFSLPYDPPAGIEDDKAYEAYSNSKALHETVDHQINGWTFTQQESPQELAANKLGGRADEWIPLLQLGWDSNVGFCFWDAGTLTFCIHREDLRRHDFSRVHVSLESS